MPPNSGTAAPTPAQPQSCETSSHPQGALLPRENQLIQELGVSRPTVVAALRVLREESRKGVRFDHILDQQFSARPTVHISA
ncbi:GntR family transcriptional regulator [Nonomuraea polychroma]|uniref:GntR family transcriptional regulator n=1 Tax=Nonomuraea polychroma TaxID=46176 RepID=UPI003D8CC559